MEIDLGQMLAFCLVMLESAVSDTSLLEGAQTAGDEALAALEAVASGLNREFGDSGALEAVAEAEQAVAGMPTADQHEAITFCVDFAGDL